MFYCRNKYYKILHPVYDKVRSYVYNKGFMNIDNELKISFLDCPKLPNVDEWKGILESKGIEIDESLEELLKKYEEAFETYNREVDKLRETLQNKFNVSITVV